MFIIFFEVKIRGPLLGVSKERCHTRFWVRLKESEVAKKISEAVGKVERSLRIDQEGSDKK